MKIGGIQTTRGMRQYFRRKGRGRNGTRAGAHNVAVIECILNGAGIDETQLLQLHPGVHHAQRPIEIKSGGRSLDVPDKSVGVGVGQSVGISDLGEVIDQGRRRSIWVARIVCRYRVDWIGNWSRQGTWAHCNGLNSAEYILGARVGADLLCLAVEHRYGHGRCEVWAKRLAELPQHVYLTGRGLDLQPLIMERAPL